MDFSQYVKGNTFSLASNQVDIKELVSFSKSNPYITELDLISDNIDNESAKELAGLPSITKIHLIWHDINPVGQKRTRELNEEKAEEKINNVQANKAVKTGIICGIIAVLAVGVGLSILFIAGISVAAGLLVGGISSGITCVVSKPSSGLDKVDSIRSNTTIDNILIVNGFGA
ncbi:MAG: hypothetical protein LBC34_03145 [Rickettsiales bacterium]|jgi:hypothetical protein|nr:hypothetical protein [Rickettsiales bacterium]